MKTKVSLYSILVLFFLYIIVLNGCKKEDVIEKNVEKSTYSFDNTLQMMVFQDNKTLFAVVDSLNILPPDEHKLADVDEFLSLSEIYNNFLSILETIENEEDYNNLMQLYSDIIDTTKLELKVYNKILLPVLNREGMVKIGQVIYCFTDKEQLMSPKNDLTSIHNYLYDKKSSANLIIHRYTGNELKTQTYCGYYPSAEVINGKRKMNLYVKFMSTLLYNGNQRVYVYFRADSYKKNWRRRWVLYKTVNYLHINECTVKLFNGTIKRFTRHYSNYYSYIDYTGFIYEGAYNLGYQGVFLKVDANASNRGTASKKAVIYCMNNL